MISIPKGQRVRIRRYDANVSTKWVKPEKQSVRGQYRNQRDISQQEAIEGLNDKVFILMEPVIFNVSSSYTGLFGNGGNDGLSIEQYATSEIAKALGLNTAAAILSGVSEYSGFQRWSSTSCIETELSLGVIAEGGDAYEEVVKPMLNLINLTIPQVNESEWGIIDKARLLRTPGPSIANVLKSEFGKDVDSGDYHSADTEFTICVGPLVFDHVVITKVTPTIMPDTDINGYPLSAFLKLTFRGTRIPNDEMMTTIFGGWTE